MKVGWIVPVTAVVCVCLIGALAASGPKVSAPSPSAASSAHPPIPASAPTAVRMPGLPMLPGQAPAQAARQGRPQGKMVQDYFKNIQVLRDISVDDFMGTMGIMSAALGFCCSNCHTGAGTDQVKWEEDTPRKRTARRMVQMVQAINKVNFGGRQVVTCWTCHRGRYTPVVTPELDTVYGEAHIEADDILMPAKGVPTVDALLNKFVQAIGGAQKVAAITSIAATGKSVGFGGFGGGAEVEFFSKAPDQRAVHIHFPKDPTRGDSTRTFNGKTGWMATPLAVLRKYELTGGELDGARFDAQMSFPWDFKKYLTNLRVGPPAIINDQDYDVIQGNGPNGLIGTLYFHAKSGLLERIVRLTPSPIGRISTQIDLSDYRDVNGVKFPFKSTYAWLDGQDKFELTDVKFNVAIDPKRFDEPNPMAAR